MTRLFLTPARVRAAITGARSVNDVIRSLRLHRIRYTWTTDPGFLALRIVTRSGAVILYRAASRSAPFIMRPERPAMGPAPAGYPYTVPRWTWDD